MISTIRQERNESMQLSRAKLGKYRKEIRKRTKQWCENKDGNSGGISIETRVHRGNSGSKLVSLRQFQNSTTGKFGDLLLVEVTKIDTLIQQLTYIKEREDASNRRIIIDECDMNAEQSKYLRN